MSHEPNAILAINSTDRYLRYTRGNANQPVSNTLEAQFLNEDPFSNDFSISAPNALMNGYIEKIIISQVQLQYNLPTVTVRNDTLPVWYETGPQSDIYILNVITIPYGYYSPDELAAVSAARLNTEIPDGNWTVTYSSVSAFSGGDVIGVGFTITTDNEDFKRFYFASPTELRANGFTESFVQSVLKTYKLFGFNARNSTNPLISPDITQLSNNPPNFLYTPFIDIYSDALTNYQKLKDTDSSTIRAKGLIARLYLSGTGAPQFTSADIVNADGLVIVPSSALGCNPFVTTYDLNNPKIINWTPDTAINSLDFQLRDCYGDLLFCYDDSVPRSQFPETFNTEFQMTLLCVEKEY